MKRWEVKYLGKAFMLYGNSVDEVREKYGSTIDNGSDITPIPYPQELFDKLTALPVKHRDNRNREYREINCGAGYCVYRMNKDENDGQYYDLIQYRRSGGKLIEPCLWSACTAQEFADIYLAQVPVKKCGFLISLKEVKKLCGKVLFKINKVNVWRDSDGYYYIGSQIDWSKRVKDEYQRMSRCKQTAVMVEWTEGVYGSRKIGWFESEDKWQEYWSKISREQPSCAATLHCRIIQRGYNKLPVEERKVICRLAYMNIERELQTEPPELVAKMWMRINSAWLDKEDLLIDIVKKIAE